MELDIDYATSYTSRFKVHLHRGIMLLAQRVKNLSDLALLIADIQRITDTPLPATELTYA